MKKDTVHGIFEKIMIDLSFTGEIHAGLEGCSQKLSSFVGKKQDDFHFSQYVHSTIEKDWSLSAVEFPIFSGNFFFYIPKTWDELKMPQEGNCASFLEGESQRQTLFLLEMDNWRDGVGQFLKDSHVIGFATFNFGHQAYNNLLFVTEPKVAGAPYWVWAAFTAGDWIVLMKGDATSPEMLQTQITSLINSCPWLTWLKSALACG